MTLSSELRLWQLISPSLPVGAYSYSQGLETAVDSGWVTDAASCCTWIDDLLSEVLSAVDLPLLARLHQCRSERDDGGFDRWNQRLIATRDTQELREQERAVGSALARLLRQLDVEIPTTEPLSHLAAFAAASVAWEIDVCAACRGFAWSWCEAQVAAAVRLVPLGHSAGQRILFQLGTRIDPAVERALALADDAIGASAPGLAIASCQHETQYSRLFRS